MRQISFQAFIRLCFIFPPRTVQSYEISNHACQIIEGLGRMISSLMAHEGYSLKISAAKASSRMVKFFTFLEAAKLFIFAGAEVTVQGR